jgi:Family of unknown function (DUF5636)
MGIPLAHRPYAPAAGVAQGKPWLPSQAPPVYRPAAGTSLQSKMLASPGSQFSAAPPAQLPPPPVYRPAQASTPTQPKLLRHPAVAPVPPRHFGHPPAPVSRLHAAPTAPTAPLPPRPPAPRAPVLQRYRDVREVEYRDGLTYASATPEDREWLDDFHRIQELLSNEARVRIHLKTVNTLMKQRNLDVSSALAEYETAEQYAPVRPMFLRATTPDTFYAVVSRAQPFIDMVSTPHGSHTHRLQWSIVALEIAANPGNWHHSAVQLYQEAVNPRWRKANPLLNMWDLIVDSNQGFSPRPTDFTRPENLEAYLVKMNQVRGYLFNGGWKIARLARAYSADHHAMAKIKNDLNAQAPPSEGVEQLSLVTNDHGQWTGNSSIGFTVRYQLEVDPNTRGTHPRLNAPVHSFTAAPVLAPV